jgi:hypothetical protein
VIHQTPPPATVSKVAFVETAEATRVEAPEAETGAAEATGATKDLNLEDTLEVIENILLKMAEEEVAVVTASTAIEKGKNKLKRFWKKKILTFKIYLGKN